MVEIKRVQHSVEEVQFLDLYRVCFGFSISPQLWKWKYLQNPLALEDSDVIVALDNGRLVGARPFMFHEMWLEDKKVKVAWHCDTMVHPDYRNRGIFNQMGQLSIQYLRESDYALSCGFPGLMSRPGFLRQGWRIVGQTDTMFRIIRSQRLLTYKLKNKLLGRGLGFLYDVFPHSSKARNYAMPDSFQIHKLNQFSTQLRDVDTLRDGRVIDLVRDERYLRWRFDWHPEHDYKYIVITKDKRLCGYAVVSLFEEINGLILGVIVDFLVKDKDITCFRLLINQCLKELEKQEADIILILVFNQPELKAELSKHFSFRSSSKFPYNKFFGYRYLDAIQINERVAEKINIYDPKYWRVTYAYDDTK